MIHTNVALTHSLLIIHITNLHLISNRQKHVSRNSNTEDNSCYFSCSLILSKLIKMMKIYCLTATGYLLLQQLMF